MSDKQKGLQNAIEELLPGCEHRFCVLHLYQNFKGSHKGLALKNILWVASRVTRVVDFERCMNEMKERDKATFDWLVKRTPTHWSKAYFSTHPKCDILLNNLSESFNSMVLKARSNPIVHMLESIRLTLMKTIYRSRDEMKKHSENLCPKIEKYLEQMKKKSMEYIAHWNGKDQFEIETSYGNRIRVHLGEKTCSCRKWELTGIPCAHALSGMYYCGYTPESYVDECYKRQTYFKSYTHLMNTLNGNDMWPKSHMEPLLPPVKCYLGRKKKPSNMTDGESSGAATTNEMGRKRKQTNDHMDEGLHIDTQTSIVQGNNDVASPSRVTRSKTNAVPSPARVTRSKRNTVPSPARLTRSKAVPSPPRVPSTPRRFVSQPNVPSTSRRVVNQPKVQSQPNVQSKTLGVTRNLKVQKEISKYTTVENERPSKSTTVEKTGPNMSTRAESVVPNV
ncbi:hypothetical protein BUALT_Bualt14G0024100 [Buddleja alternifolia]|uniref:SWIM-type domain-containing protein n=1 Tax=Buddleja alternifolia TaxID=168488 RepID=A0AAV6WRD8_9LAMI|nr:hypothetical protein BUALT_Bualt14G0024100 [Buddleja alternifolia]